MSKLKLWEPFSLCMVLLLMLSLAAVVPAPVQASVSGITVNPYDTHIIGLNTGYRITMTNGASLNSGDTIVVEFPSGTDVSGVNGETVNVFVQDTHCTTPVTVSDQEVTITVPTIAIVPGVPFTVTFNQACGITNPSTSGSSYSVTVWTSEETVHVTSNTYEITAIKNGSLEYSSIQDAIDDADPGNTITVPFGIFTEDLAIYESLTIQGSGAATTTIIGVHDVSASDVSISDCTLALTASGTVITVDSSGSPISGFSVEDCIFDMPSGDPGFPGAVGIAIGTVASPNKVSDVDISGNTFNGPDYKNANPWKIGGSFLGGSNGCEVENLTFQGNTVNRCSTPINLHDQDITNILIDGNTFANTDGAVYIWEKSTESPTGVLSQFVFTDNDLSVGNTYGVAFIDESAAASPFDDDNFGTGNVINHNDFSNIIEGYGLKAVSIFGTFTTFTLDATDNYWGSPNGPVHAGNTFNVGSQGEGVSDDVDYVPWYDTDKTGTSFAPVALGTGTTHYSSIQAAIDAAGTDDIITCQDGTFTEDLDIPVGKDNLELKSVSGKEATTIKGIVNTPVWPGGTPNINVLANGVKIHGFTIEGPDYASTFAALGMIIGGTNCEIYDNAFKATPAETFNEISQSVVTYRDTNGPTDVSGLNIHDNTFAALADSTAGYEGIFINHTSADPNPTSTVTIEDNTFGGKVVRAITTERSKTTISGNTIITDLLPGGAVAKDALQGINVQDYGTRAQANVTITGNTVKGSGTGKGFAWGIMIGRTGQTLTNVSITGNTVQGNDKGILVKDSADGVVINNNNIVGNTTYGVQNEDASMLNARKNYWGHVSGPSHDSLVSYGDKVSALVDFCPWLVTTYTGTSPAGEIVITTSYELPDGDTSTACSETISAVGGTGSYTWAYYSGTLPDGLSFADGNLSGTPTAPGDFDFGFQVKDGAQATYKDFEMTVEVGAPVITTTSLPNGTIDIPYGPETLSATGGDGSYAWSINPGDLPDGLSLEASTGKISGTPTAAGTFDFNVEVVSGGLSGYKDLSITIGSAPPAGEQKLIGADDSVATGNRGLNYFVLDRFAASETGDVDEIRVKCGASGNVKVAIYDDDSGSPGALLSAVDTGTAVLVGWNTISITPTSVIAGEYYWLAFSADANCVSYKYSGTNTRWFKPVAYSGFSFPDPAGSGFTTGYTAYYDYIAGWSVSSAATAPEVANSGGATDITSSSARLNGEVIDTGGENPTVIVYWGDEDGGETIANWDHNVNLGAKSAETFYTDISGLSAGTPYYYRCFAQNSGGSDWAGSSENFTTLSAPVAPTVINLEESDVTSSSARLNGQITDTGGEDPTVTIYWGDNDGGENQYDWDHNVNLGVKGTETFYTGVSGLSGSTTYYYRCFATNSGGDDWAPSSEAFDTLAGGGVVEQKLIGADDSVATGNRGVNYFVLDRFAASETGDVDEIRVKCGTSGNVKVAIYDDDSGSPGALLSAVDTGTAVLVGWNTIPITPTSVIAGEYYWLAFSADANCVSYKYSGTNTRWFKPVAYSGFSFPDPAGSGFTTEYTAFYDYIAGWEVTAPPGPPATPPTLGSPKRTITFEWSAVDGATTYWLQVNTSSGFEPGTMAFEDDNVSVTSQDVALNVGTTYYWRVRAGNSGGWSVWPTPGSITP